MTKVTLKDIEKEITFEQKSPRTNLKDINKIKFIRDVKMVKQTLTNNGNEKDLLPKRRLSCI
jgi:hypothetical protein